MENVENVENVEIKTIWKQETRIKIGMLKETIEYCDADYVASVFVDSVFLTSMSQKNPKNAFLWLYGVKQYLNDKVASYKRKNEDKFERETKKGIEIYTQVQVTAIALDSFREFALPSQGEGKEKKISVSSAETVLASLGLSEDVLAKARQAMGLPVIPSTTPTTVS